MKSKSVIYRIAVLFLLPMAFVMQLRAQTPFSRDTILLAAREIITETTYCGLVTIDSTGQPQTRTMNPFPLKDDFTIWFATTRSSRKIRELRHNPRVSVYYANHLAAKGYVNITGKAVVIDDREMLKRMKRDYWESIPNWQDIFVLIKIVPETIEVINYKHRLNNDPLTFRAPTIKF